MVMNFDRKRTRSRIQAAEMSFLRRVAGSAPLEIGRRPREDPGHARERLCLSAGLRMLRSPPGRAGESVWGEGSLGISAQTAASVTRSWKLRMKGDTPVNSTMSVGQARKLVEQLKIEASFCRIKVSKAAADLMAYCDAHSCDDPLISPVPTSENPFREKKFFCALL
ncbi:hypothetical protein L3Q82_022096 [Scortum barcoo]|uniref:Uncharacterized protein n=1 Tax=Scortum barcoo TaxID=214431 RepID=A0ACB8X1B2_9TELE|nr:hypothetical protein L3Q82_022096 [Scortum barcoo]